MCFFQNFETKVELWRHHFQTYRVDETNIGVKWCQKGHTEISFVFVFNLLSALRSALVKLEDLRQDFCKSN